MANDIFIWYGKGDGTKTAWMDGRNWKKTNGDPWAEARYPTSDAGKYDEVIFSGALDDGAESPTGVDLSAKEELAGLSVDENYNGGVGGMVTPVTLKVQHDTSPGLEDSKVVIDGRSSALIHLKGATGATYGLRRVQIINAKDPGIAFDGKIDRISILKGVASFAANINIMTELFIGYIAAQPTDVKLTIPADSSVSLPSEITCAGGQIDNSQPFSTLNFYGGSWVHKAGAIGLLHIRGGTFYWHEDAIDYIHVHRGLLSATEPSNVGRTLKELYVYPDGRADLRNDMHNNIVAEGGFIKNLGGEIQFSVGQKLKPIP